jgi:hypothetical protein
VLLLLFMMQVLASFSCPFFFLLLFLHASTSFTNHGHDCICLFTKFFFSGLGPLKICFFFVIKNILFFEKAY